MKSTAKTTGEKLEKLEKLSSVRNLYELIDKNAALSSETHSALKLIHNQLQTKAKDSDSPLSKACYSAIHFYMEQGHLKIHGGANIDPSSYELFKSRKHRNCAERQAACSAANRDGLANTSMRLMFLYRQAETQKKFPAEKLLPCQDCYENYICDLIRNNGHLVLIVDDPHPRKFFVDGDFDNAISSITVEGLKINYKIFNAEEMKRLNIETVLGGRVCAEGA